MLKFVWPWRPNEVHLCYSLLESLCSESEPCWAEMAFMGSANDLKLYGWFTWQRFLYKSFSPRIQCFILHPPLLPAEANKDLYISICYRTKAAAGGSKRWCSLCGIFSLNIQLSTLEASPYSEWAVCHGEKPEPEPCSISQHHRVSHSKAQCCWQTRHCKP